MKSKVAMLGGMAAGVLAAVSATLIAGQVSELTSFTAGTPAVASEVNANFNTVATEVNDNAVRIATIESTAAGGNIVLAPSTAATGNILKGADRFIHNFGTDNVFIGLNAGNFTMTGANTTAIGVNALASNTTGFGNTASGISALRDNTTGSNNVASGAFALRDNTTGIGNTASGRNALLGNTTGSSNTAAGAFALQNNTTGDANTAGGVNTLSFNTTGSDNTGFGVSALPKNTTGNHNTAVGRTALRDNTTGNNNIAIGAFAGADLTTGSDNIVIGNEGVSGESATIRVGTAGVQTRSFMAGIRGVTTAVANGVSVVVDSNGQLGTVSSSRRFKDHIADMGRASEVLMRLRPVTFYYKSDQNPDGRTLQYGLVAEEVEGIAPNLVARSSDGEIETVYYQFLPPMLLNEYQKQHRIIESQAARIEALERRAAQMTAAIARLERTGTTVAASW